MKIAEARSSPYKLASQAAENVVVATVGATGLAQQFCYCYFEVSTILLHLFSLLGLVIADLNYCQA